MSNNLKDDQLAIVVLWSTEPCIFIWIVIFGTMCSVCIFHNNCLCPLSLYIYILLHVDVFVFVYVLMSTFYFPSLFWILSLVCLSVSMFPPHHNPISFRCEHWPALEGQIIWWCWTRGNTRHAHGSRSQPVTGLLHTPSGKSGSRSLRLSWECLTTWWVVRKDDEVEVLQGRGSVRNGSNNTNNFKLLNSSTHPKVIRVNYAVLGPWNWGNWAWKVLVFDVSSFKTRSHHTCTLTLIH